MIESLKINNTIDLYSVDKDVFCDNLFYQDIDLESIKRNSSHLGTFNNLVMDVHRLGYNNSLWDAASQLWITNQTEDPQGNETTPQNNQIIYKAGTAQELSRIQGNPYRIAYSIVNNDSDGRSGNGIWGSLCWLMADNTLINRVRTGVYKEVNKAIFVELNARID